MGAIFVVVEFDGNLSAKELKEQYHDLVEEQRYEYGNGGYSGTFATLDAGVVMQSRIFPNRKEAEDHIEKVHRKRSPALAVQFKDIVNESVKKPTFNVESHIQFLGAKKLTLKNAEEYHAKAVGSIFNRTTGQYDVVVADQIKETDKQKLYESWKLLYDAFLIWKNLDEKMKVLVGKINKIEEDFTVEDWKELKTVRKSIKKIMEIRENTKEKFMSLDTKLGERLHKSAEKDNGIKWLIGGWCAE
jgi:hypothetical protein